MTFKMHPQATLKMFPTNKPHYTVLRISDAQDVTVTGVRLSATAGRIRARAASGAWASST
jgi:hypothetical protein